MKLFNIVDNLPQITPEALLIKEFKKIVTSDKSKDKNLAIKELGFIHYYCSFDNRFELYKDEDRRIEAIKTVLGLKEDWKISSDVKMAIERYSYMMVTESLMLVRQAKKAIRKIEDFIEDVDLTERNKNDAYIFSAKDLQAIVKEMPNTIKSLNDAKIIVEKELQDKFGSSSKSARSLVNSVIEDQEYGQI